MNTYIQELRAQFQAQANPENAQAMAKYMKFNFQYLGIKSPIRKELSKPFLVKTYLPAKEEMSEIVKELWSCDEREYQYFAIEFAFKYNKQMTKNDMDLFEYMALHKSWWDSIDFIAAKLMGYYFKLFPELRRVYIDKWLDSDHIWLQRCAILFQLKYKNDLDTELLSYIINKLLGSKEFFINKAIGWILREYGKVNPDWVLAFAERTELHALSRREGLRIILK